MACRVQGVKAMDYILVLLVGIVIGWVWPQPAWAKGMTGWLMAKLKNDKDSE